MNRLMRAWWGFLVLCLFAAGLRAERFRVMEWNVENLFDICHDVGSDDREFLPGAERNWNSPRYWRKLKMVSHTIAAVGGSRPPELVALVEVENDSVMTHLTRRSLLRRLGYEYVMTAGSDPRGIDVALLYQPLRFRLLGSRSVPIVAGRRRLRDVLHVVGLIPTGDTLDVLVCHQPSRAGGGAAQQLRRAAARRLRQVADSVMRLRTVPRLLLMGDMNDEATDPSLRTGLGVAVPPEGDVPVRPDALYVLSHRLHEPGGVRGTYKYRGEWNQLDHLVVSGALLDATSRFHTGADRCRIAVLDFLVRPDRTYGGVAPSRIYLGSYYNGGVSDHLPLFTDFEMLP